TAVETLGSVTVLASDKTGTLTEGRMSVRTAVLPDGTRFTVAGAGYAPGGEVRGPDGAPPGDRLATLARAAVLCNDAHLAPPAGDGPWQAVGDPLEAALLAFAARAGVDAGTVRARHPRDGEEPFDAATRRMVTRHGDLTVCKGAPEVVLTPALVEADPATLAAMRGYAAELAAAGLRVLAVVASAPDGGPLRPLGLLGIGDPVRAGAHRVVRACRDAGIENVIVTGDHPATAVAVARELGIWRDGDRAVGGGDVGGAGDGDVHGVRVFARTRPEQKLGIVAALQREGHVVAVTGDGVNDAPALRRADIGVAMGAGGTEVARQAADLVLADDELGTVVAAVAEGRRIYANIRRFLRYALSGGLAELLVMLIGPALGLPLPLLPGQILWINLLTHGLPGVAIGAEPPAPQAMRHPPRSPRESVLGGGLGRAVLAIGALIATATLATGVLVAHRDGPWQTMVFLVLGFAQLGVALAVRTRRAAGVPGNPWLPAAVALSAALLVAAVLAPPLRALLGTDPVGFAGLAVAVAVGAVPGLLVALARVVRAAGGRRTHRPGTDDSDLPGSPAHSMN
ncbi:MAG TPA: HAD-IC family P-type ATPase, partial [Rugosimonospora sp.]|nr:HAD-IC family P-type ATPase [Rugosimonospora sp.]